MDGFHVVICGGGVAALEGMLRLRSLAGDLVDVTLVAPNDEFVYRPVAVDEAVAFGWTRRYQLWDIARDGGAEWIKDRMASVDPAERIVTTGEGRRCTTTRSGSPSAVASCPISIMSSRFATPGPASCTSMSWRRSSVGAPAAWPSCYPRVRCIPSPHTSWR